MDSAHRDVPLPRDHREALLPRHRSSPAARRDRSISGHSAGKRAIRVSIILADLGMCEKAAMKWGVGFLWCALTEVGIGEFAVAAVRYFLLKKAAKKESPKA